MYHGISFLIQAGLFFYDIFWVFFTPVMVSVAKSFDAPIKVSVLYKWFWLLFWYKMSFSFYKKRLIWLSPFFCIASISNRRCCTPILYAWAWWHCDTWLVMKSLECLVLFFFWSMISDWIPMTDECHMRVTTCLKSWSIASC